MGETPLTDAVQDSLGGDCCKQAFEVVKHARSLEREANMFRAALEKICAGSTEAQNVAAAALAKGAA
jgi:hypothetical protein